MECKICGKEFFPTKTNLKKGYGIFCSRECYRESDNYKNRRTRLKIYKFNCINCGKEFRRTGKTKHRNKFCSEECWIKFRIGKNHPRYNQEKVVCKQCGKEIFRSPSFQHHKWGDFCSHECKGKWMTKNNSGENHPQWQGGISFEPYCIKFNNEFKERVRAFFEYKCVECKMTQEENGRALDVHHVNYDKMMCCNDIKPLFVALCRRHNTMANHKRKKWEQHFTEIIEQDYTGQCYLAKPL